MSIDDIFLSIGELGRRQIIYGFLLNLLNGYAAFHMLQYPFVSFNIDFTCSTRVPSPRNLSNTCPDDLTSNCDDFYFSTQTKSSIISEWSLVCNRAASAKMTMSSFMSGRVQSGLKGHFWTDFFWIWNVYKAALFDLKW